MELSSFIALCFSTGPPCHIYPIYASSSTGTTMKRLLKSSIKLSARSLVASSIFTMPRSHRSAGSPPEQPFFPHKSPSDLNSPDLNSRRTLRAQKFQHKTLLRLGRKYARREQKPPSLYISSSLPFVSGRIKATNAPARAKTEMVTSAGP